MKEVDFLIDKLKLQKHPEGGWFKEVYRSEEIIPKLALPKSFNGNRNISTSIYYLLEGEDFSGFHRIKSDEIWHFYRGTSPIEIIWIENRKLVKSILGNEIEKGQNFQHVVPKNCWFAAHLVNKNGFALAGCTVSPGFDFNDFEMADNKLIEEFQDLKNEIENFIR